MNRTRRFSAFTTVLLVPVAVFTLSILNPGAARAQDEESATEPTVAQRHFISGTELMQNFRYLDAAEEFRLAIDEDSEFIDAYRNLAFVFTKMAESEGEYYEDALELYEELEEKLPEDAEVKKNKAYVFTKLDEIDEAISTYEEIIELDPDDCGSYGRLAELHAGEAEKAGKGNPTYSSHMEATIDAYKTINERCPEETYSYNKLGEIYFDMGNTDGAAAIYDELLQKDPENVDLLGRLGYLWYSSASETSKAGDKKAAIPHFEKSLPYFEALLERESDRDQYRGLYANALKRTGNYAEAAKQWLMLIEKDPSKNAMYCNVGFTYLDAGKHEEAIEIAMTAIASNAPNEDCLYAIWGKALEDRADALVQDFQFDKAMSTYGEAKSKFSLAKNGKQFGDYALKQISRQDQLIERAKSMKLKMGQDK